jgi:putative tricarboxylic transport membrane protein
MTEGAFNQTFLTGPEFAKWLGDEDNRHRALMQDVRLLGGN